MISRLHASAGAAALVCFVTLAHTQTPPPAPLSFTDVTTPAGIRFTHTNGSFGKKYLPETMGSGVAFFDADGDGLEDLFFVNGKAWPGRPGPKALPALYRNTGKGSFVDVTPASGLGVELYGMGAAPADYDNDGDMDLLVTAVGGNRLFRNGGTGVFTDVTARAGVATTTDFSTGAAWLDYDKDGWLDLFVVNYVQWSLATDITCSLDGKTKSYCTPDAYKGASPRLYRSKRDGTFTEVTKQAGLADPTAKALGIALLDYNADGWLDLFVANDTQPNRLYRNTGKGGFVDEGVTAGVAFNDEGKARAGMGADAADFEGSGRPGLVIGNFSNETISLYRNEGSSLFVDVAPATAIGRASLLTLAFATFFFDADLDGWPDILAANGHVADDINRAQPKVTHAQPPHLFRNLGNRRFEVLDDRVGPAFRKAVVGRGAAYGDYDGDGDLDVVITANNGPARLLRNDLGNRHRWLRVSLVGRQSNRNGIGARVQLTLASGRTLWSLMKTGSSYLSQSELPLTFGLGTDGRVTAVEVQWPSGQVSRLGAQEPNRTITVQEPAGATRDTK